MPMWVLIAVLLVGPADVVMTSGGCVRGESSADVSAWKGIPFAADCLVLDRSTVEPAEPEESGEQ